MTSHANVVDGGVDVDRKEKDQHQDDQPADQRAQSGNQNGHRKTELNPSLLQPPMTVVDVSNLPETTEFLREAQERGCEVIRSRAIFANRLRTQFPAITGEQFPPGVIDDVLGAD